MVDKQSEKNDAGQSAPETTEPYYEKTVKGLEDGELILGTVVAITRDAVVVDIGYKSEGQIPLKEFLDAKGNPLVKVGDEIEILLESSEDEKGYVVLSKVKADQVKVWREIEEAHRSGSALEGRILQKIKGGFKVDLKGIAAFLPGSQVDVRPVSNPDSLLNNVFKFKVLQYDRKKPSIVVSRRALLEEDRERVKKDTLQVLEEGSIVEGTVKNITNYGVFVDLGGIDGLLHITDISWGKVKHPSDIVKLGEKIEVKVLKFNKEERRISLGLKQLKQNPWDSVRERYPVGGTVQGKVVNMADYGAFVELEEGIEGLIHLSELGWEKIKHPSQKLKLGDSVEAKVLEVDPENKRLSLSLKHLAPNPWDTIEQKYAKGAKIKGMVKNITDFGIFISVEEGIDGLVHISDMSWKKIKHPSDLFQKGQEVEAEVIGVDKEKQRLALRTKAAGKDPWHGVEEKYHPGMSFQGRVTNIAPFGAFVELEDGVEGLIHISELKRSKKKGKNVGVGDRVETEILNVNSEEKKIGLGLKEVITPAEKTTI